MFRESGPLFSLGTKALIWALRHPCLKRTCLGFYQINHRVRCLSRNTYTPIPTLLEIFFDLYSLRLFMDTFMWPFRWNNDESYDFILICLNFCSKLCKCFTTWRNAWGSLILLKRGRLAIDTKHENPTERLRPIMIPRQANVDDRGRKRWLWLTIILVESPISVFLLHEVLKTVFFF